MGKTVRTPLPLRPAEIRKIRLLLGETQQQFGRRFRVTRFTIMRWENSGSPPWWAGQVLFQMMRELENRQ